MNNNLVHYSNDWNLFFFFTLDYSHYAWSHNSIKRLDTWKEIQVYLKNRFKIDDEKLEYSLYQWTLEQRQLFHRCGLRLARINARPDASYDSSVRERYNQWIENEEWCKEKVNEMVSPSISHIISRFFSKTSNYSTSKSEKNKAEENKKAYPHIIFNDADECDAFDLHNVLFPLERYESYDETEEIKQLKEYILNKESELILREKVLRNKRIELEKKEMMLMRLNQSLKRSKLITCYKKCTDGGGYYKVDSE